MYLTTKDKLEDIGCGVAFAVWLLVLLYAASRFCGCH